METDRPAEYSSWPVEIRKLYDAIIRAADAGEICAATVYKLCAAGDLVHVRISNAIRVAPPDLTHFMAVHRAN